nr:hypothetical protein Itr_chr08CG07400 [Ipomoea trifida]
MHNLPDHPQCPYAHSSLSWKEFALRKIDMLMPPIMLDRMIGNQVPHVLWINQ